MSRAKSWHTTKFTWDERMREKRGMRGGGREGEGKGTEGRAKKRMKSNRKERKQNAVIQHSWKETEIPDIPI